MSKIKETIVLPLSGKHDLVSATPDVVFSNKHIGEGFVIFPDKGRVISPVDGRIRSIFPTKHAVIIESNKGHNILIHIGLGTVRLNGAGIELLIEEGQKIKQGTPIMKFDLEYIKNHTSSIATPVVFIDTKTMNIEYTEQNNENVLITIVTE